VVRRLPKGMLLGCTVLCSGMVTHSHENNWVHRGFPSRRLPPIVVDAEGSKTILIARFLIKTVSSNDSTQ
jgi:hypothetical protein